MKQNRTVFVLATVALTVIAALFYMSFPKANVDEVTSTLAGTTGLTPTKAVSEQAEVSSETSLPTTQAQPSTQKASDAVPINIVELGSTADGKIKIGFTGDINLDEKLKTGPMQFYELGVNHISDFIDPVLVNRLRGADILFVNNEFAFSDRGEKQAQKTYTFRANPANISVYKELGVDVASIANNHIYDYKADAMRDTIATIEGAGIASIGGGENIAQAKKAAYFRVNGKVIAFIAAGRAEPWFETPTAGKKSLGFWMPTVPIIA